MTEPVDRWDRSHAVGPLVTVHAPAKLNLTLAVVGRRADGFHDLHSVFVPLGFGDEVSIQAVDRGPSSIVLSSRDGSYVPESHNLVLRAEQAAREAIARMDRERRLSPLSMCLQKGIPVAAGLGGGSSDAASTLVAVQRAWGVELPRETLVELAAALGSDVPFFLAGSAAVVTGRGELVDTLPPIRGEVPAVLIVTPSVPIATPAVFSAYAAGARPPEPHAAFAISESLAADWRAGMTAAKLLERASDLTLANDLLPATLTVAPDLAGWREALADILGRPIGQSGSGPTAWALYRSAAEASRAADEVKHAIAGGRLPVLGEPFVMATTIGAAVAHNGSRIRPER